MSRIGTFSKLVVCFTVSHALCEHTKGDLYQLEVMADNPIAYYTFDDASTAGPAANLGFGGAALQGSYGDAASLAGGISGTALSLNTESGSWVDVADTADALAFRGSAAFTLEAWVNTTGGSNAWARILDRGNSANAGNLWTLIGNANSSGNVLFERKGAGAINHLDVSLNDGQWHHVVGTYDGAEMNLYIDGNHVGAIEGGLMGGNLNDLQVLRIGANPNGAERFNGLIDEVAIYDAALSADRIAAHYAAAIPEPASLLCMSAGVLALLRRRRR